MPNGLNRRTLRAIDRYPSPREILEAIRFNRWPYSLADKDKARRLELRDRALASLLYLVALRRSEALRLTRGQFRIEKHLVILEGIKLSKAERRFRTMLDTEGHRVPIPPGHPNYNKISVRKEAFRKEAWLPLTGPRGALGQIVKDYLESIEDSEARLFNFSPTSSRPWQIVEQYTRGLAGHGRGITPHWLRAYGENWLYDNWEKDLMAVASYVSVDPRTLAQYIRKGHMKYKGQV